jgi:hypothetical protein
MNIVGHFNNYSLIFWGRGRRRPLPQIPGLLGRREENSKTASVPIENCLIRGVQSDFCVQLVYKIAVLKGLKLDLSNAESITDS